MIPKNSSSDSSPLAMDCIAAQPSIASDSHVPAQPTGEQDCLDEIVAWNDLGNLAEARKLADVFLARHESLAVRRYAMEYAMFDDDLPAATRHALHIYENHPRTWNGPDVLQIVLTYAGFLKEAYLVNKENYRVNPDAVSWYNCACRAVAVGYHEEAFRAALREFSCGSPEKGSVRKMFLDTELRGLWTYAAGRDATVADAIRWAHCPIEWVLQINLPNLPPREVDFADLYEMPIEFHSLLRQNRSNTKLVDPAIARANPEIFRRYMEWEAQTCLPSIGGFRAWGLRLRRRYDETLPAMAQFCVHRGRPGTGRYLLRNYIGRNSEVTPDSIPPIDELEYFTAEWRRLWQIDRVGTQFLISHRPHANMLETFETTFVALAPELRDSGLGWMVLGCEFIFGRLWHEALQAFQKALKFWPGDHAIYENILLCLCHLKRWDAAKQLTEHPDFFSQNPELAAFARRAVAAQNTVLRPPNPQADSRFPTPAFGFFHRREDIEFLRWFHKNKRRFQ